MPHLPLPEPGPAFIAFLEESSIPELLKLAQEMASIPEDARFLEAVGRVLREKALRL
jgi:hypothetical protein